MGEARDAFMEIAWRDFILFASENPEMRADFRADTGFDLVAEKSAIDAVIDAVTGYNTDKLEAFVLWATEKHWGMNNAPAAYRASISAPSKEVE